MTTDPQQEQELFLRIIELPAEDRLAAIERECLTDLKLQQRIMALLKAHEEADSLLDQPDDEFGATVIPADGERVEELAGAPQQGLPDSAAIAETNLRVESRPGAVIAGRYTMVEMIGEGGMGEVWVAKQTAPVKRRVALKLIKIGMDSKAVVQRFEQERQALALMDHPNIARVLDGGLTATGQPFFVMELVNGLSLNKFCDEAKLTPKDRLELFVPICQAVQHAHQKGIVHRDLKPANILVTMIDGRPVPKVIDFGVAKATSGKLTEETMSTSFGSVVGTLEYMSPEQAGFSGDDIDTRADIYSLGVILYEMLTGLRPIDADRLRKAALTEMIRIIREEDPSKPSTRLSTDASLASVAAVRQMDPKKLMALLRGELDWVVMKCLEKQRDRRYDTANALIRDIQRYLADEVVEARPPSIGYRLQKFVRRNKGQVIAASLLLLALLVGMAGTTWGLFEAKRQEATALNEAAEKELARLGEAKRVEERDEAIRLKDIRAKERNEALRQLSERAGELRHRLGVNEILLANSSYEDRDVALATEHLDQVLPEQRSWDWRYLKQQAGGGIYSLDAHASSVSCVSFSPDDSRIVTCGEKEARVWDARTGELQFEMKGGASNAGFSPDGLLILTRSTEESPTIWDARNGKVIRRLDAPGEFVAFSPDGMQIVTGAGRVYDVQTGKLVLELDGLSGGQVSFTPDGSKIVANVRVRRESMLRFFDAVTGEMTRELEVDSNFDQSMSFRPDGSRMVHSSRGLNRATILDLQDGKTSSLNHRPSPEAVVGGSNNGVMSASYSSDGQRIVTAGGYGRFAEAKVWDARTGNELRELVGHTSAVSTAAFSSDCTKIVTGSMDGIVTVWMVEKPTSSMDLKGNWKSVNSVAISPDGTQIISGNNGFWGEMQRFVSMAGHEGSVPISVWDARTGERSLVLRGLNGVVNSVAFSPDGTQIVTGGWDSKKRSARNDDVQGHLTLWDARSGALLREFTGIRLGVASVAFSSDGKRIITGSLYSRLGIEVKVWDAMTGGVVHDLTELWPLHPLRFPPRPYDRSSRPRSLSVAFNPNGTRFIVGGILFGTDGELGTSSFDAQTGELEFTFNAVERSYGDFENVVHGVRYSPDGQWIATADSDGKVRVWDAGNGQPQFQLLGHTNDVNSVDFSPDGSLIVTGSTDETIRVWDALTSTTLVKLEPQVGAIMDVTFSDDGSRILAGSSLQRSDGLREPGHVMVWEVPSLQPPQPNLKAKNTRVQFASFSPDGSKFVTKDSQLRVWDIQTQTPIWEFPVSTTVAGFSPDSKRLITASSIPAKNEGNDAESGVCALKVWDLQTGKEQLVFQVKNEGSVLIEQVAFSLDGDRIVLVRNKPEMPGPPSMGSSRPTRFPTRVSRPSMLRTPAKSAKPPEGAFQGVPSLPPTGPPSSRTRRASPRMPSAAPSNRTPLISVFDTRTGKEIKGEPSPETVPVLTISPDRSMLFQGLEVGSPYHSIPFRIARLKPSNEQLEYRSRQTRPNVAKYMRGYLAARAANDETALEFYRDLILAYDGREKGVLRIEQADMQDLANQASLSQNNGDLQEAAILLEQVVDWRQANLGIQDRATLAAMSQLGGIYRDLRQYDNSTKMLESLVQIYESQYGRQYPLTRDAIESLGLIYNDSGRFQEAIPLLEEVVQASSHAEPDTSRNLSPGTAMRTLFGAYVDVGETEKVEQELAKLRDLAQANNERFRSRNLEEALQGAGQAFLRKQIWLEAERMFREHLKLRQRQNGRIKTLLGAALLEQQRYAEAEEFLLEGYNELKRGFPHGPETRGLNPIELKRIRQQPETVERLVKLYQAWEKLEEAAKWQKELDAIGQVVPPDAAMP